MASGSPSVLIVDDEKDVADVYALGLPDEYAVRTAHGGRAALEAIDDSTDVVLLDRHMPDMTGGAVLEEIRERGLNVRVAMVTAVDPDLEDENLDFDAYLVKPADATQIRGVVEDLSSPAHRDGRSADEADVAGRATASDTRGAPRHEPGD